MSGEIGRPADAVGRRKLTLSIRARLLISALLAILPLVLAAQAEILATSTTGAQHRCREFAGAVGRGFVSSPAQYQLSRIALRSIRINVEGKKGPA
jgi:hypothetical protein